jgi:hypothetical protein
VLVGLSIPGRVSIKTLSKYIRVLMLEARFALNYKRIEYKTEWVEYPDVEDLWKSLYVGGHPSEK